MSVSSPTTIKGLSPPMAAVSPETNTTTSNSSEKPNKRKQSSSSSSSSSSSEEEEEAENQSNKRQQIEKPDDPPTIPGPPPLVALPPPLLQYHPNGQYIPIVHPHQQAAAAHAAFYYQQPIYFPVSPQQQHPYASSPETPKKTPRLLPKSPSLSPYFHPYASSPPLPPRNNSTSTADEREKARKVSHSAIERRRRERINDKIFQLKQLIPACVDQDNLHKMSILQSAIDYIAYLKEIVTKLENNESTASLLKGEHLVVKTQKSMIPKEIEPYTTQFSVKPPPPPPSPPEKQHMSIQNILC